jgi:hypothetical protein
MKHFRLLFLTVALVSLILLAVSLSNLQLQSGSPFPGGDGSEITVQSAPSLPPTKIYSFPVLQGFLALISIFLVIYVSARLLVFVNIKKVLPFVLAIIVLLIAVYLLPNVTPVPVPNIPSEYSEAPTPSPIEYPVTPLGEPPQLLLQFVIIGIVLGGGLITFMMIKRWSAPTKIEDELLRDAKEAVNALQDGKDFKNAIIRCYLQMTHSIQKERGLERNYSMTVQEFEHWLIGIGFPTIPLQQLTSLFEKVRYGKQPIDDLDEQIAMNSLNEIIKFCQSRQV